MTMTTKLLSFHNDPAIKEKYLLQLKAHALADEIIKGVDWQNGKGSAVGCTIHSNNHEAYETELGIPAVLAYLEDEIFAQLPNSTAKDWPLKFLSSISVGADLSLVWPKWIVAELSLVLEYTNLYPDIRKTINNVIGLYQRVIKGKSVSKRKFRRAAAGAGAAARAAARVSNVSDYIVRDADYTRPVADYADYANYAAHYTADSDYAASTSGLAATYAANVSAYTGRVSPYAYYIDYVDAASSHSGHAAAHVAEALAYATRAAVRADAYDAYVSAYSGRDADDYTNYVDYIDDVASYSAHAAASAAEAAARVSINGARKSSFQKMANQLIKLLEQT